MPRNLAYCTIVARNYVPQALVLHASIQRQEPDHELVVLLLDGELDLGSLSLTGIRIVTPQVLGLSARRLHELQTAYDLVEFATSVKPLLLKHLLHEYEQAVYLDPDTYVVSPMEELPQQIQAAGGILLTPHFLEPIPPDSAYISEIHSLNVGVYNLGFCGTGRDGVGFLDWWWSHLENECLIYPLLGLFVDQKWVDMGASLFPSAQLRHYGYNVAPWNLHERDLRSVEGGFVIGEEGVPLRLFHFSGFDARQPDELTTRFGFSTVALRSSSSALQSLCNQYARELLAAQGDVGPVPEYAFNHDTRGNYLTKRMRRAYRTAALYAEEPLPSPFIPAEAEAFSRWRRSARTAMLEQTVADAAIATKYALPDEYARFRGRLPGAFTTLRARLLAQARVRR